MGAPTFPISNVSAINRPRINRRQKLYIPFRVSTAEEKLSDYLSTKTVNNYEILRGPMAPVVLMITAVTYYFFGSYLKDKATRAR